MPTLHGGFVTGLQAARKQQARQGFDGKEAHPQIAKLFLRKDPPTLAITMKALAGLLDSFQGQLDEEGLTGKCNELTRRARLESQAVVPWAWAFLSGAAERKAVQHGYSGRDN